MEYGCRTSLRFGVPIVYLQSGITTCVIPNTPAAEVVLCVPTALEAALHPRRRMCSLYPESRGQYMQ